jgi:carboxyl-terminal processing protease
MKNTRARVRVHEKQVENQTATNQHPPPPTPRMRIRQLQSLTSLLTAVVVLWTALVSFLVVEAAAWTTKPGHSSISSILHLPSRPPVDCCSNRPHHGRPTTLPSVRRPVVSSSSSSSSLPHHAFWLPTTRNMAGAVALCFSLVFGPGQLWMSHAHAAAVPTTTVTTPQLSLQQQQQPPPPATATRTTAALVQEVWTLVDKYYLDRTFNHQNWKDVQTVYLARATINNNNNDATLLVAEMIATLGDKYSRLLDAKQYAAIQKYDLIGVGVTLQPKRGRMVVGAPPIPGSAADRAGLRVGDMVTAINGKSTAGRTAFDIIDQLAEEDDDDGDDGDSRNHPSMVVMSVRHDQDGPTADYTMQRGGGDRTSSLSVTNPIRYTLSEHRADGTNVGYIKIVEFNARAAKQLQRALHDLSAAGANAYVLDLRQNGGGAFQAAVEISSLFVSDRVATRVVDYNKAELPFRTAKNKLAVPETDPVVVWMDGFSASASEVLAGSLRDNCRAVLMGNRSFGKGLIQAVYGLKNGAGLVLTVANYVTPNGSEIQGVGLQPDVKNKGMPLPLPFLESDTSKIDFGEIKSRLDPSFCKVPQEKTIK